MRLVCWKFVREKSVEALMRVDGGLGMVLSSKTVERKKKMKKRQVFVTQFFI